MAELTVSQRQAIAIASARLRLKQRQSSADPNQAIIDRQKAAYPTSEEMGGTPGAMVQPETRSLGPLELAGNSFANIRSTVGSEAKRIGRDLWDYVSEEPSYIRNPQDKLGPIKDLYGIAEGTVKGLLGTPGRVTDAGVKFASGAASGDSQKMSEGTVGFIEEIPQILGLKAGATAATRAAFPSSPNKLTLPKPERPTQLFSDALNGKRSMQFETEIQGNIDRAFPDLKRSEGDFLKGPVKNKREAVVVGEDAYKRVYAEDVKPHIQAAPVFDLRPLAIKLKAGIPEWFTAKEVLKAEKTIDGIFNKQLSGTSAEALRQKLRAENKVNIAKNAYERAAVEKTARGWTLGNMYSEMRTAFADHVQVSTGADIRPALGRYGALTDIVQELKGSPIDPTILERIEGSFLSGTRPNTIGQATRIAGSKWRSSDALIRRAFAKYDGPRSVAATPPQQALPPVQMIRSTPPAAPPVALPSQPLAPVPMRSTPPAAAASTQAPAPPAAPPQPKPQIIATPAFQPSAAKPVPLMGANPTEAATIAARGRRPELLKETKAFDEQRIVDSPLFQGRGGPQGFLGVDERAAPAPMSNKTKVGSAITNMPVKDLAAIRMKNWAEDVRHAQEQFSERGRSVKTMESNAEGKMMEEAMDASNARVGRSYGLKEGSPLEWYIKYSPGKLAEAIESKSGGLYEQVKKSFEEAAKQEKAAYSESQQGTGVVTPERAARRAGMSALRTNINR